MRFRWRPCGMEVHTHAGMDGIISQGDIRTEREKLISRYAGQVQTIYLDPPFNTGKEFLLRQRCGEEGWVNGQPVLGLPAYSDRWQDDNEFFRMMREAVEVSYHLLRDEGSFFLHIDSRTHARMRIMLDEVFGEKNFVNEIIWCYQSGGRATAHFSRKHDIILFYRKTPDAFFDIQAVGTKKSGERTNHMRRAVDEQGRAYRSILSHGKEYRYYDDEPVLPSDVWNDVSHLQQRDPERTGFDNQKPMKLLERIILCSSRPGDLVMDLFAGSGTTAVAAAALQRRFFLLDVGNNALIVSRKRLLGKSMRVDAPCQKGIPHVGGGFSKGLGLMKIWISTYELEEGLCSLNLQGIDAVDQISAGFLRGNVFYSLENAARTKQTPTFPEYLEIPMLDGMLALLTVDVLGRRMVHVLEDYDGE